MYIVIWANSLSNVFFNEIWFLSEEKIILITRIFSKFIKSFLFDISIKEIPGIKTYQNMTFNKIKDSFTFLLVYSITNKNSFQKCQY